MLRAVRDLHEISARLDRGELTARAFLFEFTRALCRGIGCSRTGIWVFSDDPKVRKLRCMAHYDADLDRLVPMDDFHDRSGGGYFDSLARDGHVMASHAWAHPVTTGFRDSYLQPMDVRSVLDVSFAINGTAVGVFRCEERGRSIDWTGHHLQLLRAVGPRAALSLLRGHHRPLDTAPGALWEPQDAARRITRAMTLPG
jgi:GAF domain-containing protein